jgi:hypothetical protein
MDKKAKNKIEGAQVFEAGLAKATQYQAPVVRTTVDQSVDEYDRCLGVLYARLKKTWHSLIAATEGLDVETMSPAEEKRLFDALTTHFRSDLLPHCRTAELHQSQQTSFAPPPPDYGDRLVADFSGDSSTKLSH